MIDKRKIAVVAYVSSEGLSAQRLGVVNGLVLCLRLRGAIPSSEQSRSPDGLSRWVCVVLASSCGWLVMGVPAWATHEVNHRFEVTGTVRAADGAPRPNIKVVVSHPRSNLSETALTDRGGRYSVLLHLHDKDAGDPVTVAAGDETTTIKADYDPKDHHTRRLVTVDFGPTVQRSDDRSMTWWYGVGGAAVIGGVIYWRLRAKRSRRSGKPGRSARRKAKSHA